MPPPLSSPPSYALPAPPCEQARWFEEEVQPHQSALRAWLRSRFPNLTDVDDLVQESLVRVWRSRDAGAPPANARSYLFTVARNAALDLFRRNSAAPMEPLGSETSSYVIEERPSIPEIVNSAQELEILHEAIAQLPDRCRAVMRLQKIQGRSNQEIADELGISVHTVNAQIVIGLMRCRQYLRERGVLRGGVGRNQLREGRA